jgi:Peptidase family M28
MPFFFVKTLLCSALLLALPCASAPPDSISIVFDAVAPALIQQRLELVTRNLRDRRATLQSLFEQVGCEPAGQPVPHSSQPNILCALPGETASTIVVGGHFDLVETGIGAVDDWSGAVLLPSLYQRLKSKPRRHRFIFAGFAAEEQGLYGSKQYVKSLQPEEIAGIRAMVNLECLGMAPPKVWASRADKRLLHAYALVAAALHLAPQAFNVDNLGDDDSHPFLSAKIPVITFHSVTSETFRILHSARDNLKAIHPDDYYDAYRLAAGYLAFLDTAID